MMMPSAAVPPGRPGKFNRQGLLRPKPSWENRRSLGAIEYVWRINTIVIGGGQGGLSVGYHLAKKAIPFVILEANRHIGDSWRNRWDSLRLFTLACYAGLDGMPFPASLLPYKGRDG